MALARHHRRCGVKSERRALVPLDPGIVLEPVSIRAASSALSVSTTAAGSAAAHAEAQFGEHCTINTHSDAASPCSHALHVLGKSKCCAVAPGTPDARPQLPKAAPAVEGGVTDHQHFRPQRHQDPVAEADGSLHNAARMGARLHKCGVSGGEGHVADRLQSGDGEHLRRCPGVA